MKKKFRLYLETTIPNYLFADDTPRERDITKDFWERIKESKYKVFISRFVLGEIEETQDEKRRKALLQVIEGIPFLEVTSECESIAKILLKEKVIPKKYEVDAYHIAVAIVHKMDSIVSWNLDHIVNTKTRLAVIKICNKLGFPYIDMATPEEVMGSEEKV